MRERLPLGVLLASALTLLASLFLPWREAHSTGLTITSSQGFGELVKGGSAVGWVAGAGDVAALLVVALALATIAALRRPELAPKLPFGSLGAALAYFAAAVAVEVHALGNLVGGGFTGHPVTPHTTWAYGFYLGAASGAIAGVSGLALRRSELRRPGAAGDAVAGFLGIALLVSFLLPWIGQGNLFSRPGIDDPAATLAAAVLIFGAPRVRDRRRQRLPLVAAIAILTAGAASATPFSTVSRYGTWIGVGCVVLLVAVEAARGWPLRLPVLPRGPAALELGAAALLIVALFLPWQEISLTHRSWGTNGWYVVAGAAAGGLCLLLLATALVPAVENYALDLAIAVAVFGSLLGTVFRQNGPILRLGYGADVGLTAAGILLVTALLRFKPGPVERTRALALAMPLAASVLCVAAIVVPMWFVLPQDWTFQATALYYGWFSAAGALLALYLVRLWALRVSGARGAGYQLTLAPIALLALGALDLIRFRSGDVVWGAVILVCLCLLLALLGWIEEHSGLAGVRVPEEIWRVDRLPEPES
ncbi:MAG TPA: hypothetical protein VJV76_09505 [Gaiellaceae bacterium]|nr:hypothetical protein [Gaiellaceae bacterium]